MLDGKLLMELQKYLDSHLKKVMLEVYEITNYIENSICEEAQDSYLIDYINNKRKPAFNKVLFSLIDKKGASDSDIYKYVCWNSIA